MVVVAQLVRALDCGPRGRGFKPHLPPDLFKLSDENQKAFFYLKEAGIPVSKFSISFVIGCLKLSADA